jgi:hypothetical protein
VPALRKHSDQDKARAAIQVRRLRLEIVISGYSETPEFDERKMRTPFYIFTDSPGAQPVWIESTQDIEDARERLREVARIAPRRDCFIYSDSAVVEIIVHADFQALRRHVSLT